MSRQAASVGSRLTGWSVAAGLVALLALPLLALPLLAGPSAASVADPEEPEVIDPFDPSDPPSQADLADSVRQLDPEVRPIELPDPRSLRTEESAGERTEVTISADVLFDFAVDELTPRAEQVVRQVASDLAGTSGTVQVVGHTDSVGSAELNQGLSERRAESVAEVLRDVLGPDREIETEGRGFDDPVADDRNGDDSDAAALNRRVEITYDS